MLLTVSCASDNDFERLPPAPTTFPNALIIEIATITNAKIRIKVSVIVASEKLI
jgi:hypothetical protein